MLEYSPLNVSVGESVELQCNTSLTSNITWTFDDDGDGYVDYVYWNGRVDRDWPWLFVKTAEDHVHILGITDAEPKHSGLYDCYDGKGMRKVGCRLVVNGRRPSLYVATVGLCDLKCCIHRHTDEL